MDEGYLIDQDKLAKIRRKRRISLREMIEVCERPESELRPDPRGPRGALHGGGPNRPGESNPRNLRGGYRGRHEADYGVRVEEVGAHDER